MSHSAQGDGDDDANGIVWTDPSSGVKFVVDKRTGHSYPPTLLTREFDKNKAHAVNPPRKTIVIADPCDREREPPQWMLDALKVSTMCAGQRLET